jgi:signal transduction histidine kinase/ActR/RegA family two-component response regulator
MKLRTYLVLLVLGAVLPLLAFATIMVVFYERHEVAAVEDGLRDMARGVSVDVDRELASSTTTLFALAASEYLDAGDLAEFRRFCVRVLGSQPGWSNIVLQDTTGRQLVNLLSRPGDGGGVTATPEVVTQILGTGRPVVSNLFRGQTRDGGPILSVTVPVRRDGRIRYLLAASFDAAILTAAVLHQLPSGTTGILIDRTGAVIGQSGRADRVGRPLRAELTRALAGDAEVSLKDVGEDGQLVYTAATRSSLSGWTILLSAPATRIEASLWWSLGLIVGGGLCLVLLGLGLATLFGRRLATSMALLSGAAAALGRDEAPSVPALPIRELGDVGRAVGEAGDLLRRQALERRHAEERRDQIEADLRQANEAKDEFLAMLGHELRNPIGAIRSAVKGLERLGTGGETAARLRAIVDRQAGNLGRLVDDLLDVSRVTSGKITLHVQPVDLREVARRALDALGQVGRADRHDVRLDGEPVLVEGDPTRLEQIVSNILENAVKYTPPGGRIRVTVGREGSAAVLRVTDSGLGIAPETLPRIFDVFAQGERPLDRTEGGLGLGLTLVRRLTELHGGTVAASSEGRGRGSEFVIRLPVASGVAGLPSAPAELPSGRPLRVFVVEDNADAREALRLLLELWGHRVEEAADGPRGVEAALAATFDVALIDIGLPGLDGYRVARRLREAPHGRELYLVALTGYGQPDDRRRALEAGFDAHLVKPVEVEQLAGVLARAVPDAAA